MKVYASKDFKGHWPVGTAAVILAEDEVQAKFFLRNRLRADGLGEQTEFTIHELKGPGAYVLNDGNY